MLLHGVSKLRNGVSGIEGMLGGLGLPGVLAYGVFVGEVLAPLLVLAGFYAGPAALVMAVNMLFAIGLAHRTQLLDINAKTGGHALELQLLFLFGSLAIALLAPRRRR
ncbi:MAG TPA: DoxX family membrane protein [Burkholderiaceae bacterium]|nr:DoxX family membrane protein [Burkholderiaceae bacterium]